MAPKFQQQWSIKSEMEHDIPLYFSNFNTGQQYQNNSIYKLIDFLWPNYMILGLFHSQKQVVFFNIYEEESTTGDWQ